MLLVVVAPVELLLVARSLDQWQGAGLASGRVHADALTLVLRLEAITIAVTSTIPESRATAVFAIEEPSHRKVSAGTSFLRQRAGRRTVLEIQRRSIRTAEESRTKRNCLAIATTSVRRTGAVTSLVSRSLGHRLAVQATAEF